MLFYKYNCINFTLFVCMEVRDMKKVWLVVTIINGIRVPKILGVYSTKEKAEKVAYTQKFWCNVIEKEVQ